MNKMLTALGLLALWTVTTAGMCATSGPDIDREPEIVVKEVAVPVRVDCVPKGFPPAPAYPDTDQALKAAPDGPARYQLVLRGRLERIARGERAEAVVDGCR